MSSSPEPPTWVRWSRIVLCAIPRAWPGRHTLGRITSALPAALLDSPIDVVVALNARAVATSHYFIWM